MSRRLGKTERRRLRRMSRNSDVQKIDLADYLYLRDSVSVEGIARLIHQLGYSPSNLIEIAAGDDRHPTVILLYPLNRNNLEGRYGVQVDGDAKGLLPFPTIFWMTCPELKSRVSKLEDEGWILKLEHRLLHSPHSEEYVQTMKKAHELYAQERWDLLSEEDKELIDRNNWTKALRDVGIAGMWSFQFVKCLHTHYCHHLARPEHGNLIGQWVDDLLSGAYVDEQLV